MNKQEILNSVIMLLRDMFRFELKEGIVVDRLSLYGSDISLSSMDYVQFIVGIEQKFSIKWPDEYLYIDDITVGEVVNLIEKVLAISKENN